MVEIDPGIDSALLIEAEIEILMRRLLEVDSNALLRIEKLVQKLRIEIIVLKHFN